MSKTITLSESNITLSVRNGIGEKEFEDFANKLLHDRLVKFESIKTTFSATVSTVIENIFAIRSPMLDPLKRRIGAGDESPSLENEFITILMTRKNLGESAALRHNREFDIVVSSQYSNCAMVFSQQYSLGMLMGVEYQMVRWNTNEDDQTLICKEKFPIQQKVCKEKAIEVIKASIPSFTFNLVI